MKKGGKPKLRKFICMVCGKEFERHTASAIVCSNICRGKYNTFKSCNHIAHYFNCGKEIIGVSIRKKYCSMNCYNEARRSEYNANPHIRKVKDINE